MNDGAKGILYPYNQPDALAFKIMTLIHQPERMHQLSANAFQEAKERHRLEKIAQRLRYVYKDVFADSKRLQT